MTGKRIVIVGKNLLAKELLLAFKNCRLYEVRQDDFTEQPDVVIETTNLDLEEKKRNLQGIEASVSPQTLILSTALQLTATEAASWLRYPERLVGFGTFANFKEGNLIETALPLQGDTTYTSLTKEVFSAIGHDIEVVNDEIGLVFPRILAMIVNEAAFALMEKTADAHDIDTAMRKGTNYPHGPLEWAEKIGIDDIYAVLCGLYRELGEERYRPAPLIRKLVYAGWIGGEMDEGFYHYQNLRAKELMI